MSKEIKKLKLRKLSDTAYAFPVEKEFMDKINEIIDRLNNIEIKETIYPKFKVLVVYKSDKNKNWRGFCSPFDVSCEAKTLEEAKAKLEKLVELYEEGLRKYGYPSNLSVLPLSEKEDMVVFKIVMNHIAKDLTENYLKLVGQYLVNHADELAEELEEIS